MVNNKKSRNRNTTSRTQSTAAVIEESSAPPEVTRLFASKDEKNIVELEKIVNELSKDKDIVDFIVDLKNTVRFLASLELNRLVALRQVSQRLDHISDELNKKEPTKKELVQDLTQHAIDSAAIKRRTTTRGRRKNAPNSKNIGKTRQGKL